MVTRNGVPLEALTALLLALDVNRDKEASLLSAVV
jgi:hypothetical protein